MGILNKRNNITEIQNKKLDYSLNIKPQLEGIISNFSDENNNNLIENSDINLNYKLYNLEKSKNRSLENALFENKEIQEVFSNEIINNIEEIETLRSNVVKVYSSNNENISFTYTNLYMTDLSNNNTGKFVFKNLSTLLENDLGLLSNVLVSLEESEDSILNRLRLSKEIDTTTNFAQSLVNLKVFKENSIYPNSYLKSYFKNENVSNSVYDNQPVNGAIQTNLYEHEKSNNRFFDNNSFSLTNDFSRIVSLGENDRLKVFSKNLPELETQFDYSNEREGNTLRKTSQLSPLNINIRILENSIASIRASTSTSELSARAANNRGTVERFRTNREIYTIPLFWLERNLFNYQLNSIEGFSETNQDAFRHVLLPENITTFPADSRNADAVLVNNRNIYDEFSRNINIFPVNFMTTYQDNILFRDSARAQRRQNAGQSLNIVDQIASFSEDDSLFSNTISIYKDKADNNNNAIAISRHDILEDEDFGERDVFANLSVTTNYDFQKINSIFNSFKNKKSFFAGYVNKKYAYGGAASNEVQNNIISFYRMYKDNTGGREANHYTTQFLRHTFNGLLGRSLCSEVSEDALFGEQRQRLRNTLGTIFSRSEGDFIVRNFHYNEISNEGVALENENRKVYSLTKKANNATAILSDNLNYLKDNRARLENKYQTLSGEDSIISEDFDSNYLLGKYNDANINLLDYTDSNAQYQTIKSINESINNTNVQESIVESYNSLKNRIKQSTNIKTSKYKNSSVIYKEVLKKVNQYFEDKTSNEKRSDLVYNYGITQTLKEDTITEISQDILSCLIIKNFNINLNVREVFTEPEEKNNFLNKNVDVLQRYIFSESPDNGILNNNRLVYDFLNSKTISAKEYINIFTSIKNAGISNEDFKSNTAFVENSFRGSLGLLSSTNVSRSDNIEETQLFNFFYNSYDTIKKLNENIRIGEGQIGFRGHDRNLGVNGIFDINQRNTYPLVNIVRKTHPNLSFNTDLILNGKNFVYKQNVLNPRVVFPEGFDNRFNYNIRCRFDNVVQEFNYSSAFSDSISYLYTEQLESDDENLGIISIISDVVKEIILEMYDLSSLNLNNITSKISSGNTTILNELLEITKNISYIAMLTYKEIFEEISYSESFKAFLSDMSIKSNITNSGKTLVNYSNDYLVQAYLLHFRIDSEDIQQISNFTDERHKIRYGKLNNVFDKQVFDTGRLNSIIRENLNQNQAADIESLTQVNSSLGFSAKFAILMNNLASEDFSLNNIYKSSFKFLQDIDNSLVATRFSSHGDFVIKNAYKNMLLTDVMKSINEDFVSDYLNLENDFFEEFFGQISSEELIENNEFIQDYVRNKFSLDRTSISKTKIAELLLFLDKKINYLKANKSYIENFSLLENLDKIGTQNHKIDLENNESIILSNFPSNIETNPHIHSLIFYRGNYPSHVSPGRRNISVYSYNNNLNFSSVIYPIKQTVSSLDQSQGDLEYYNFSNNEVYTLSSQDFFVNTDIIDSFTNDIIVDDNFNSLENRSFIFANQNINIDLIRNIYQNNADSIRYNQDDIIVPFDIDNIVINNSDNSANNLKLFFKNNVLSQKNNLPNMLDYKNNNDSNELKTAKHLSIEDAIKDKINKVYLKYKFGIDLNPLSSSRLISKRIVQIMSENDIFQKLFDIETDDVLEFHVDENSSLVSYRDSKNIIVNHINKFLCHLTSSTTNDDIFNLLNSKKSYFTVCNDPSQSVIYHNKSIELSTGSILQNESEVQRFGYYRNKFNREKVINKVELSRKSDNKFLLISNDNLKYNLKNYQYPSDYFYFIYTGENNEKIPETNNIFNIRGQNV